MMKIFVSLLLMLSISACAQRYTHATKSTQDFERDKYECEKIARHQAAELGSPDNPFMIGDKTDKCLRLNGWTPK